MHIELTDHLRCPREHGEAFLVLLPDRMVGRHVAAGHLGCPVCGWSTAWTESVPDFGGGWRASGPPPVEAAAAIAMVGIDGPGGWLALAGNAAALAGALAQELAGVGIVAINPPLEVTPGDTISVVMSGTWPLKTQAMRGVILGTDALAWRDFAIATTLPGLRTIGSGEPPPAGGAQLLASAEGVWVVTHK